MKKILLSIYLNVNNLLKITHILTENQMIKLSGKDIFIGKYTYGTESTQIFSWGEGIDIKIGRFSSIRAGLKLFCGENHMTSFVSSYPFGSVYPNFLKVVPDKSIVFSNGDIKIGNDVWIGKDLTVMSGISIGDGSVIAENSNVVKNVKPYYSIYCGNTAKFIRDKFSEEIVEMLLKLQWWNYEDNTIEKIYPTLLDNPIMNTYYKINKILEIHNPK